MIPWFDTDDGCSGFFINCNAFYMCYCRFIRLRFNIHSTCVLQFIFQISWASETCSVQLKGYIAIMQRDGIVWTPVPPSPIDGMPRHRHKRYLLFVLLYSSYMVYCFLTVWYLFFRNILNHLIKNQNQHAIALLVVLLTAKILFLCVILLWLLISNCRKCNT